MHSQAYLFGVVVGILFGILLVGGVWALLKKVIMKDSHPEIKGSKRYDERQLLAQGFAYKCGFWCIVVYEAIFTFGRFVPDFKFFQHNINGLLGMLIGVLVYGIICVVKDAYISIYDKPAQTFGTLGIILVANVLPVITMFTDHRVMVQEQLNTNMLNLYCSVMVVIMMIAVAIKMVLNKRQDALEDE